MVASAAASSFHWLSGGKMATSTFSPVVGGTTEYSSEEPAKAGVKGVGRYR